MLRSARAQIKLVIALIVLVSILCPVRYPGPGRCGAHEVTRASSGAGGGCHKLYSGVKIEEGEGETVTIVMMSPGVAAL